MDMKLTIIILMALINCLTSQTVEQANALLLTTLDSISLVYPKEMNYENDFLHIVFKLSSNRSLYRIEDAVYDNKTWSIFFIISNSSGGSELIRLRRRTNFVHNRSIDSELFEYSFELASNWIFTPIFKHSNSKILSLDINSLKRKLYWFEFNTQTQNWFLTVARLSSSLYFSSKNLQQILIENKMSFSNDGYSYISVVRDNYANDISFFISNNESLNLCHLINMTCVDFFRSSFESTRPTTTRETSTKKIFVDLDEDYYDLDKTSPSFTTNSLIDEQYEQVYKYGKLMGIKYDSESNVLYLSDYLNDRIDRVTFSNDLFKLNTVESILKSEFLSNSVSHVALNPVMSFLFDNYIYWIDYEDGLKTSLYKSSCFRSIYKVKDVVSLKLITITLSINSNLKLSSDPLSSYFNNLVDKNGNDLISLKSLGSKYKYPPDYVYYYSYILNQNGSTFDFDFSKSFSQKITSDYLVIFIFFYFSI